MLLSIIPFWSQKYTLRAKMANSDRSDPFEVQSKPELVFAIVAPLGIDLDELIETLRDQLSHVNYKSTVIRLSELLSKIGGLSTTLKDKPEQDRIRSHMAAGTELRSKTEIGGILARIAIAAIQKEREQKTGSATKADEDGRAYILRSIKHKEEIQDLRDVYGEGLITISAYAPKEERKRALTNLLGRSSPSEEKSVLRSIAGKLIETDEAEEGKILGQNVEGAFPLADLFVEAGDRQRLRSDLRRFIQILFGNHFLTPSKDEFGIFQAAAAARRSADLSRQVGAALASKDGEILALGCNDTPKAGGGLYWPEDAPDGRDFALFGHDPSEQAKREIVSELLKRLEEDGLISGLRKNEDYGDEADRLLSGCLKSAQISSLLEFGRVLHAEMAAITDAARRGTKTRNTTLYCTTFPCHLCARLIIASGICRVVFIEPYPKSKTQDLYHDSVTVDQGNKQSGKVNFQSFVGVAPRRYEELFRIDGKRKSRGGAAIRWDASNARPRIRRFQTSYIFIETKIAGAIPNWLQSKSLSWDK